MQFNQFFFLLPVDCREVFAAECETTVGHLNNIAYGYRPASPTLAVLIEKNSKGAVTRQALRPGDWSKIWPELIHAAEKVKP